MSQVKKKSPNDSGEGIKRRNALKEDFTNMQWRITERKNKTTYS